MTDREAMQTALEALNLPSLKTQQMLRQRDEAIAVLRAALEQQAEPVHGDIRALKYRIFELEGEVIGYKRMLDVAEAPPQRKPLTDTLEALFTNIDHAISSGAWNVQIGSQTWEIIQEAKAAHGIGEKP